MISILIQKTPLFKAFSATYLSIQNEGTPMFGSSKKGIIPNFPSQEKVELLTKAIGYLPDKVQDFFSERLIQITTDERSAHTLKHTDIKTIQKDKIFAHIYLPWYIWEYYDDEEIMRIILHEIASIYIDATENDDDPDTLTALWGFKRRPSEETRRKKQHEKKKKEKPKIEAVDQKVELIDRI
jgi:hypothetical protein